MQFNHCPNTLQWIKSFEMYCLQFYYFLSLLFYLSYHHWYMYTSSQSFRLIFKDFPLQEILNSVFVLSLVYFYYYFWVISSEWYSNFNSSQTLKLPNHFLYRYYSLMYIRLNIHCSKELTFWILLYNFSLPKSNCSFHL